MVEHGSMDIKAHQQSYGKFLGLLKFGVIACAIIAAIVVFLISR